MFCSQCGKKLSDEAKFCTSCGAKVRSNVVSEPEPEESVSEASVDTAPVESAVESQVVAEEVFSSAPVTEVNEEPQIADVNVAVLTEETVEAVNEEHADEIPFFEACECAKAEYIEVEADNEPAEEPFSAVEYAEPKQTLGATGTSRVVAFFRGVLSVFMCIIIVALSVASLALITLKSTVSDKNIQKIVSDPEFSAAMIATFLEIEEVDMDDIADELSRLIYEETGIKVDTDGDALEDFLTNSKVTSFFAEKVSGVITDVMKGTNDTRFTEREIKKWLEKNTALVEKTFDVELTEDDIDDLVAFINLNDSYEDITVPELEELIGFEPLLIQFIVSNIGVIAVVVLTVCLLALLFIVNKHSLTAACGWTSAPLFIVGTLSLLVGVAFKILPDFIFGDFEEFNGLESIVDNIIGNVITWSAVFLGLAFALVLTAIVVKFIKNKISTKTIEA